MTFGDWAMATACVVFGIAGLAKYVERQPVVATALVLVGLANALLLYAARRS